jgi:hypothetical protein
VRTSLEVEVSMSMQAAFVRISRRVLKSSFDLIVVLITRHSNGEGG